MLISNQLEIELYYEKCLCTHFDHVFGVRLSGELQLVES